MVSPLGGQAAASLFANKRGRQVASVNLFVVLGIPAPRVGGRTIGTGVARRQSVAGRKQPAQVKATSWSRARRQRSRARAALSPRPARAQGQARAPVADDRLVSLPAPPTPPAPGESGERAAALQVAAGVCMRARLIGSSWRAHLTALKGDQCNQEAPGRARPAATRSSWVSVARAGRCVVTDLNLTRSCVCLCVCVFIAELESPLRREKEESRVVASAKVNQIDLT